MTDPALPPIQPSPSPAVTPYAAPAPKKSRWKVVLIVIGVLALLGVILGTIVWRATQGAADAANAFLETTATKGPAASRDMASPAFQQNAPPEQWDAFAKQIGLTGYKSASWTKREITNDVAHLEGTMATQAGGTIPLTVELVKTNGKWLVQLINAPQSGFQTSSNAAAVANSAVTQPSVVGNVPPTDMVVDPAAPPTTGQDPGFASAWQGPAANAGQSPSGDRTSMVPQGGAVVPGAKVAGTCMTILQEKTGVKFDSIECLSGLPAQVGASIQCSLQKGAQRGQMTVTVTSIDQASKEMNFHCSAGSPM